MGTIFVDEIKHQSAQGSGTITIGASGETVAVASGSNFSTTGITDNSTSTAITIDSSERVGIGTSSPNAQLDVVGTVRVTNTANASNNSNIRDGGGLVVTSGNSNPMYFYTGGSEAMRITSAGDFLVGKTSTSVTTAGDELRADGEAVFVRAGGHCLRLQRLTNEGNVAVFYNNVGTNTGSISVGGSATAYNTSSDYRLKNNISDVLNAIDRVKQLKPIRFSFIAEPNKTVDGFLAHEVQDVVPEAITGEKDAVETYIDDDGNEQIRPFYQGIDQSKLVPLLTAGLQEAIAKIETLEARITALENA